MENLIGVGDLGSKALSDYNAEKFGTLQDTVDALNSLPEGKSAPARQVEAQFAANNPGTDVPSPEMPWDKKGPETYYPEELPKVYDPGLVNDSYMIAHGNVKQKFDATLSLYRRNVENAVKYGDMKIGNIPTADYAVFSAWRNGDIEIDESNAKKIFPSLMSVISNGEVKDDFDGSFFMSWQKRTNDRTHEFIEGFTQTSRETPGYRLSPERATGDDTRITWDVKATADGFKRYFDTLEAGDVAMQDLANERLLEKDIGLKPGENFFAEPHERQVEICKRAVPFYSDLTRLQTAIQGTIDRLRDTDVDCESNDAGQYILKRILDDGDVSRLPSWQKGVVSEYLTSTDKRSAQGLAEWMLNNKGKLDTAYSEHLKDRQVRVESERAMNPVGGGGHALGEWLNDKMGFDELSVVVGKDGKGTLSYKAGGITDREFILKGKVIDDLVDADGRYSAQRAMAILNENPGAWAFVRRWAKGMHGAVDTSFPSSITAVRPMITSVTSRGAESATYELRPLTGDQEGAFTMMMDYLYSGGDEKTCKAAMEAFSLIDKRVGSYASGGDAYKAYAGTLNAVDSGVTDFIRRSVGWVRRKVGTMDDAADYAAEWCAKHQGADEAEWKLKAKHLYEGMSNASDYTYFSDNTIAGGALEFYLNLKAMGGLFGMSKKVVGGSLWAVGNLGKGIEKVADVTMQVGGMSRKVEGVALAVGEVGAHVDRVVSNVAPLGKWLAVGGMSPSQAKVANALKGMRTGRVDNLLKSVKAGDGAAQKICMANIEKCDTIAAGVFKNFNAYKSVTEKVADFMAKIPGSVYFYDTAKSNYVGAYLMSSDKWDFETLQRNENFATAQGVIEAAMMAGVIHVGQGNKAFTANAIKALRTEARALDAEVERLVSGAFIPGSVDATKGLARNVVLQRAWESCRKAWVENAKFMFTLEEAKAITDNCKTVADMKAQDPDYKPTVWDFVCAGQGAAITETLKVANTTALLGLAGGAYATVKSGNGKIGPSKGQVERIAKSRVTLAEGKIAEKVGESEAAEQVGKFLEKYTDADRSTRSSMRDGIRKQFGEDAARLLEQAAFEVEKSRTDFGAKVRGGISVARELYAAQDMTPDKVRESLSKLVSGEGVSLDKMPDGSLRVKLAKGTKIGGFTLDADRTVVVKTSNMKGLNSLVVDGKTVYDKAWCEEIIAKYREGSLKGEFADALDKFLAKQMSDGQREKKLAKLAAGENIEKLLSLASETLTNAGIYIPKTDPRFGKALGNADANLVDGILMLADVTDSAKTPNKGLGAAEAVAARKGINVKTFLHEYLHAIVDMLPIGAERAAELAKVYGDKPWQEGIVDDFLDAHTDRISAQRAAKFRALSERGVLQTVADAAKKIANAFGIKTKADENFEAEGNKSAIDAFVKMLTAEGKTEVDADGEVVDKTEVDRRIDKTKKQIFGGSFRIVSKEEMTAEALKTMRMSIYKNGGIGIDPMDYVSIDALADNWLHKDVYPGRYPRSVFRGFDRKADGTLARSIVVTSLNSTNQAETSGGVAKLSSLMVCANLNGKQARDFVIERKGKYVKGLKGYDPESCIAWGGDGYVKLDDISRDALMLRAREVQEANIRIWAKDNDVWFNGIDGVAKELGYTFNEELNGGVESRVWADAKRGKVVKHLWNMDVSTGGDINKTLDRVVLFNSLFPESKMRLLGWGEVGGKFGAFIEQPYFVGGLDVKAEEIDALMAERGFKRISDPEFSGGLAYVSKDGSTVVRDVNEGGVIRNVDGSLSVIDAICALNTKQNAIDGVVPVDGKGFKSGSYMASWRVVDSLNIPDDNILNQMRDVDPNFDKALANTESGKLTYFLGFHGTRKGGFTVFDPSKSDDGLSLFFANTVDASASYVSRDFLTVLVDFPNALHDRSKAVPGIYNVAVRLENPLIVDARGASWTGIIVDISPSIINSISDRVLYLPVYKDTPLGSKPSSPDTEVISMMDTRNLSFVAHALGYDGVIIKNVYDYGKSSKKKRKPFDVCIAYDGGQVKLTDPFTYNDNGQPISIDERMDLGGEDARWNIIGQRSFAELLGQGEANVASKIVREEFRKAFAALESDEARDARKRVLNDEVNRYLESKKSNELPIEVDGKQVTLRFYRGGADAGARYEYGGSAAVIPRNFKKAVAELKEDGSLPATFLTVGDFYKKDPLLGNAATIDNGEVMKGVIDARVFVKGTDAWKAYANWRAKHGQMKTEPLMVNGVGVNAYGDVVIDQMGDNRTISRKVNMGVVKLMQRFEGWETPLEADKDFFRHSDLGGVESEDSFNFGINSWRLKDFVGQAVKERLEEIERDNDAIARNFGRSFDFDEVKEKVDEAVSSCIRECVEYFNSEIEAKALGARFGVDVEKLPSYSEMQKAVVDGLIKPFNKNGLTAAMNSRNVVKFYRDVVVKAVAQLLPKGFHDWAHQTKNLQRLFMQSVRDCYREIIARYLSDAGGIEEAAKVRENLFVAKDYKAGGMKGENAETTIAQRSDVAETVQTRLDKDSRQKAAYAMLMDAMRKGVNGGKSVKDILSAPELRKAVYDSIIDAMRKEGAGDVGVDEPLAQKDTFDVFQAALTDFTREISAQWSVVSEAGGMGKYNQIVRMLWAEDALKRSNARLRVERRDLKEELHSVKRTAQKELAAKDREIRDAKAEAEHAKYLADRQVAGIQKSAFKAKEKYDEFREKYGEMADEKRRLEKRVANADANRVKASRIRNAVGMSPAEVVDAFGGKDMVDALVNGGAVGDGKTPISAGRFANEMAVEFAVTYRDRSAEFRDMPISEFFSNPIVAAEFANTVASWLKYCARKCAYGRVRSAAERDAAALRRLLRPNFLTVKGVLEENVRKMVDLRQRMEANRIVENVRKTLDKRAKANKKVEEQTPEFKRLVDPLHQEYWRQVGKCLDMTPEEVAAEIESLKAKFGITEAELGWAAEKPATEGLRELTAEQVRDRRAALLRVAALSRYGAMKYLPVGELGDKVGEISHDIETSRKRFDWLYGERTKEDGKTVEAFVSELAKARSDKTGAENIELGKSAKLWRGALYYCVPDLFLRMKMFFPKGSAAYEMCENFRRDMSLAHIEQARIAELGNRQFVDAIREIYGGREFDDILRELMTPHAEWSKFSRRDWDAPGDAEEVTVQDGNGRLKKVRLAKMGANPNRTKSADGLSKAQLMYIYAACTQGDMKINNIIYGRDASYFKEIAGIIGPEGHAVVKWMRQQFEMQMKAMSPICEAVTGMPIVAPVADYFPLKFEQDTRDPMDARRRYMPDLFPSFLKSRESHGASRLDDRLDVFHVFNERLHGAAHYIAFAEIIDRVRTTFGDSRVQTAYAKTIGTEAYREMYTQMATALNGGVPDQIKWLAELRNFTTASTLFYNIPSAIKQFEGVGGWSAEMGLGHWLKSLGRFMRSTKEARDAAADIDQVVETRKTEGFSDVARALKDSVDAIERGGGKIYNIYQSYKRHGLTLTTFIDTLASRSLAGAYYSQKFAYYRSVGDSEAEAKRKAIADVDYAIQTTQQSSRPEFLIGAQRGDGRSGEFGKMFAQFAGPAYVRLGMELEALHRYIITSEKNGATKEQVREARREFVNKAVALHVVCPAILTALEMLGKALTHNDDDRDFVRQCAMSYARNVLVGPFAGMFLLGAYIERGGELLVSPLFEGRKKGGVTSPTVPMLSRMWNLTSKTAKAFETLKEACMDDLDRDRLLDATLKTFEAVLPPLKHGVNAVRNISEALE